MDGAAGGIRLSFEKAVDDRRAGVAPDDGRPRDTVSFLLPPGRYAQIGKDLDTALGKQEAGDIDGAQALLTRAAKAIFWFRGSSGC